MIVSSIKNSVAHDNPDDNAALYQRMSYPVDQSLLGKIDSMLLDGPTTYLFSGSWRLMSDNATYVELKVYKNSNLPFHHKTIFLEPNEDTLYRYVLKKLNSSNIVILHSDYWVAHLPVETLLNNIDDLRQYANQVICTLPIRHLNFNKLKLTIDDVCKLTGGVMYGNSIIITR